MAWKGAPPAAAVVVLAGLVLSAPGAARPPADRAEPDRSASVPRDTEPSATETGAGAAGEADSEPRAAQSERIVVFGRAEEDSGATLSSRLPGGPDGPPLSLTVLQEPWLEAQGGAVLGDVLEDVSGLLVQPGSRTFDAFLIRGFDSVSSALVLTDGVPEPEATFHDLYNLERLEVVRGPAGVLVGGGGMAGAVNAVRKRPTPDDHLTIETTAGSYGERGARLDWNRPLPADGAGLRLNALVRSGEDFRDRIEREVTAFNPVLSFDLGERTSVDLSLEAVTSEVVPDPGLPLVGGRLPDVPRRRNLASPQDTSDQEVYRADVTWSHRPAPSLTLRQRIWYRALDWTSTGTVFSGVAPSPRDPGTLLAFRNLVELDDRQELFGTRLDAVWTGTLGGLNHRVVAGVELARQADEFTLAVGALPPVDPFAAPAPGGEPPVVPLPELGAAGRSRIDVVAPFLLDRITLAGGFGLLLGVRYDELDFDDRRAGTSRSEGDLSPIVGLSWSPGDHATAWATYSEAFAPPSPRATDGPEPEESDQWELGIRGSLAGGRLEGALALYHLTRQNIAIPDETGFTQQTGDQRSRGIELELAGELGEATRATVSYAYNDAELTEFAERVFTGEPPTGFRTADRSGNVPAFAPRHLARAWITRDLTASTTAAAGIRYVGEHFAGEDNATEIDPYALAELALTYREDPWRVRLGIENLTDEAHELRALNGAALIPGPPRTWHVTLGFTR